MNDRTLLLGMDLDEKYTQLAIYNKSSFEPELVGKTEENPEGLLETAVKMGDGQLIRDFLGKAITGEKISVGEKTTKPVNVLTYFFKDILSLTKKQYPNETIKQLVISIHDQSPTYIQTIYDALENLGIEKDRATVISHRQAYLYYVLYQKKEIWINDVGMFEFQGNSLTFYQMQMDRRKSPILVNVTERKLTEVLETAGYVDGDDEVKLSILENVIYGAIHKKILSALFMVGDGFENEWINPILKKLCVGRRVFKGRNLYVSGACLGARELSGANRLEGFLLLDDDMIMNQISLKAYKDAKTKEIAICKVGTPWFLVDESIEIIPDGDEELVLNIRNVFSKGKQELMLDLSPVADKLNKMCRLRLRVRFEDVSTCIFTLTDLGFGEIEPSSNRIWERIIKFV